ncbi:MAG TPA: MFS transporter, partial [Gaiellaceae bacterium]|nr:MFS transporter [Gaiellaceae bacterium]
MRQRFVTPENKKWWTLGAVSVGLFMIMLDNTVVNVALPSIRSSLGMSIEGLEWVVAGYALTFAAFMLVGGKLADFVGRRLIFMIGLAVFTGASLACGLAPTGGFLIAARVVQGLGGALMNPATLSIITATFAPRERGKAIGIWAGVSAMALAIGPLVGGLLTEHVNWNWIFFINVPVGIAGLVAIPLFIDETRDESADQRLDVPGLATSALGLFSLTYAFIEANNYGWTSARILGALAISAASLVTFLLLERRQRAPMLDLSLFRNRTFSGANASMLFVGLAMFGTFFYVSLYMQNVLGYSPVQAGASFLPMTILIILIAPRAGALTDRVGSRWLVGAGMTLLAGMLFYYSRLGASESFWAILPGLLLGGIGMGMTMTPVT